MAANTSPDSITYPISTDPVAPLETVFANLANTTQNALNKRQGYAFRWANAAARIAQTGMRVNDIGYQVDTDTEYRYSGSTWIMWNMPWRAYTPTVGVITMGNGSIVGAYSVVNGTVHTEMVLTLGSTTVINSGLPTISLPLTAATTYMGNSALNLNVYILDNGSTYYGAQGFGFASSVAISANSASGVATGLTSTVPLTWATGDAIFVSASYRAA